MSDEDMSDEDKQQPTDQWLADVYNRQQPEPSAALDAAVLQMAQDEHPAKKPDTTAASNASSAPTQTGGTTVRRLWVGAGGGLAAAAVVFLSISVFLRVDDTQLTPAQQTSFSELEIAAGQVRAEQEVAAKVKMVQSAQEASDESAAQPARPPDADRQQIEQPALYTSDRPKRMLNGVAKTPAQAPQKAPAQRSVKETPPVALAATGVTDAAAPAAVNADVLEEIVVTASQLESSPTWQIADALAPAVDYFYPSHDSVGQPVVLDTAQQDGAQRIHAYSVDRSEVYVEVMLYPQAIDVDALYAQQKRFIESEDPRKQEAQVADLVDTFLQDRKARQATIRYTQDGQVYHRRMYFLNTQIGGQTVGLRVVIDPRSQTNHEMIEYLELN